MEVIISLGSNLASRKGEPADNLALAMESLKKLGTGLFQASSLYESTPVDCPEGSPRFINAVVRMNVSDDRDAEELLTQLQCVEADFGRKRVDERNAPRILDLDLISFGTQISKTRFLTLPHPRAHLRRFVLEPLAEMNPSHRLPGFKVTVTELIGGLPADPDFRRL